MENCIFCKIVKEEIPSEKIFEDESVLAFLDISPINIGHTLIIPKEHFKNIYETPDEIMAHMMKVSKKICRALDALAPDGVNVTMNNNPAAGQVIFHSHIHVIPRYEGDGFELWHSKKPYAEGEMKKTAQAITQAL